MPAPRGGRAPREGWPFGHVAPLAKVARYFPLDPPGPDPDPEPTPPAGGAALPAEERRARARAAQADLYGEDAA